MDHGVPYQKGQPLQLGKHKCLNPHIIFELVVPGSATRMHMLAMTKAERQPNVTDNQTYLPQSSRVPTREWHRRRYGRHLLLCIFIVCIVAFQISKLRTLWDVSVSTPLDMELELLQDTGDAMSKKTKLDVLETYAVATDQEKRKKKGSPTRPKLEPKRPTSERGASRSKPRTYEKAAAQNATIMPFQKINKIKLQNRLVVKPKWEKRKLNGANSTAIHALRKTDRESSTPTRATESDSPQTVQESPHVVVVASNEAFLWQGAQSRLCTHIKKELDTLYKRKGSWKSEALSPSRLFVFAKVPCTAIHERNQHGNFMVGFYGMRLAALAFNATFKFHCAEDDDPTVSRHGELRNTLYWWLQTKNLLSKDNKAKGATAYKMNYNLYNPPLPTGEEACAGMGKVALHYTSEYARRDLREMALKLSPHIRGSLDEVAIHWRCGDVLSRKIPKKDKNYGLLKFQAYRRRIPSNVRTIGIVTAPFASKDSRNEDRKFGSACQHIAFQLVAYLQGHFPRATVHIRNDPTETIPMVYSRLILANYTFCARSTFCLFPAVASLGTSFIQEGGVAYFVPPIAAAYDNIHMMDEPVIHSYQIGKQSFNSTVQWLLEN